MGYERSTFPLAVYGCINTASRKVVWLCIWTDNYDPKRIARWCFDFLFEKSIVTARLEIVKGSEPSENVLLGKSTLNQTERW